MNTSEPQSAESWPRKLNKALIAIGVIAFGLIVTDRLLEAFRADDLPADQATLELSPPISEEASVVTTVVPEPTVQVEVNPDTNTKPDTSALIAEQSVLSEPDVMQTDSAAVEPASTHDEQEMLVKLESMFGSRVVFVSAAEPAYLVTADERRFEVGKPVDDDTTLAGITAQQVFFDRSGDLIVISLPEPTVQ